VLVARISSKSKSCQLYACEEALNHELSTKKAGENSSAGLLYFLKVVA
jgi:hypothetical protein